MAGAQDLRQKKAQQAAEILAGDRGPAGQRAVRWDDLKKRVVLDALFGSVSGGAGGGLDLPGLDGVKKDIGELAATWAVLRGLAEAEAEGEAVADALSHARAFRDQMLKRIGVNYVRTGTGTDGVGDWINGVTTSTDVPSHAPAGARSLVFSPQEQAERPLYNENLRGRTIRASGWIKSPDDAYFRARGSTTNDEEANNIVSGSSTVSGGSGWREFAVEFQGDRDTTHWGPSIGMPGSATTLAYDLRFDDVTGAVQKIEELEASIDGGLTARVTQHMAAISDLEGNALAYAGLIAEIDGTGKIAGIRAQAFQDAADGIASSLLELIGDNVVAEGTLSTNKLVVGLGKNQLTNTRFRHGLRGWNFVSGGAQGAESAMQLRQPGETWASAFYPTLQVYQAGTSQSGYADVHWNDATQASTTAPGVPCAPGDWIEVSVNTSAHRCTASLVLRFFDDAGNTLSPDVTGGAASRNDGALSSSSNPDLWPRVFLITQAPAGAAFVRPILRKGPTDASAGGNSFAYWHKPQVAFTHESATYPAPYGDDGTTLITPQGIVTPSLKALSAVLGEAMVDWQTINDRIETPGFSPGDNNGFSIRKNGTTYFNGPVIIRQLVEDAGSVDIPGAVEGDRGDYPTTGFSDSMGSIFVETTGVSMTAWSGSTETYLAEAGVSGTRVFSYNDRDPNVYWGVRAVILPLTKWDDAQGDARLRLRLTLFTRNVDRIEPVSGSVWRINWRIYRVT